MSAPSGPPCQAAPFAPSRLPYPVSVPLPIHLGGCRQHPLVLEHQPSPCDARVCYCFASHCEGMFTIRLCNPGHAAWLQAHFPHRHGGAVQHLTSARHAARPHLPISLPMSAKRNYSYHCHIADHETTWNDGTTLGEGPEAIAVRARLFGCVVSSFIALSQTPSSFHTPLLPRRRCSLFWAGVYALSVFFFWSLS